MCIYIYIYIYRERERERERERIFGKEKMFQVTNLPVSLSTNKEGGSCLGTHVRIKDFKI